MQLKLTRLRLFIVFILLLIIIVIVGVVIINMRDITFLRCENCMQLWRLRKDWLEALPGLRSPSSKLPRLRSIRKKVEMVMVMVRMSYKNP